MRNDWGIILIGANQGAAEMVIILDPELEAAINESAGRQGVAAEVLAVNALRERFLACCLAPAAG